MPSTFALVVALRSLAVMGLGSLASASRIICSNWASRASRLASGLTFLDALPLISLGGQPVVAASDPVMTDGSPVQTDFVMPSDAEIRKRAKALELVEKRSRPIRIVSFEVE
jgi:hypothetical protein